MAHSLQVQLAFHYMMILFYLEMFLEFPKRCGWAAPSTNSLYYWPLIGQTSWSGLTRLNWESFSLQCKERVLAHMNVFQDTFGKKAAEYPECSRSCSWDWGQPRNQLLGLQSQPQSAPFYYLRTVSPNLSQSVLPPLGPFPPLE